MAASASAQQVLLPLCPLATSIYITYAHCSTVHWFRESTSHTDFRSGLRVIVCGAIHARTLSHGYNNLDHDTAFTARLITTYTVGPQFLSHSPARHTSPTSENSCTVRSFSPSSNAGTQTCRSGLLVSIQTCLSRNSAHFEVGMYET